jgi:hypothetical protein
MLASNSQACGDQIRAELLQMFPGKDLGRLDAFCGMQIHHSKAGMRVSLLHHLTKKFSLFNILPLQPRAGTLANPLSSRPLKADCPSDILPNIKSKHPKLTGMLIWIHTLQIGFGFSHPCHYTGDAQPMPEALGHSHSSLHMRMLYTKLGPVLSLRAPPGHCTFTLS